MTASQLSHQSDSITPQMERRYMPQLDGLRAVAVMSVLIFHWFVPPIALGQWGVTLFFVLSGYLITQSIASLKASGLSTGTAARIFFVRRALRLFPAYYLMVLIGTLLYADIRRDWAWYAGYAANFLMEIRPHFGALKASWSLSAEEQFYIVWFFALMCLPTKGIRWILALAFVAEPLVRCAWLAPDHPAFRTWTLWANCDGLVLGVLLYRLESSRRNLPLSSATLSVLAAAFAVFAALVRPESDWYSPFASVLVSTLCAGIVWHARHPLHGIAGRLLSHAAVVYVGRISYGVYLYHMIIPGLVNASGVGQLPGIWRLFQTGSVPGFLVHCVITIGVASVSFHLLEMPIRRLAKREGKSLAQVEPALTG
jgi:peptidoglycan/LPS O-acetylase OafA/YrhL